VNINIPVPKIRALHMGAKTLNGEFIKRALTIVIKCQKFIEVISLNRTV
jgi:hypothetical protein